MLRSLITFLLITTYYCVPLIHIFFLESEFCSVSTMPSQLGLFQLCHLSCQLRTGDINVLLKIEQFVLKHQKNDEKQCIVISTVPSHIIKNIYTFLKNNMENINRDNFRLKVILKALCKTHDQR